MQNLTSSPSLPSFSPPFLLLTSRRAGGRIRSSSASQIRPREWTNDDHSFPPFFIPLPLFLLSFSFLFPLFAIGILEDNGGDGISVDGRPGKDGTIFSMRLKYEQRKTIFFFFFFFSFFSPSPFPPSRSFFFAANDLRRALEKFRQEVADWSCSISNMTGIGHLSPFSLPPPFFLLLSFLLSSFVSQPPSLSQSWKS